MAIAAGDQLQVKIFSRMVPQIGLNVRHFIVTSASNPGTEQAFCNALSLAVGIPVKMLLASAASYFGIKVERRIGGIWTPVGTSTTGAGPGSAPGDAIPAQVSGLISLRTGLPGRANRGRAYVPFPAEFNNDSVLGFPSPNGAYVINLDAYGAFLDGATVVTTETVPASYPLVGQIYHRAAGTFTPITSTVSVVAWATQKRRGFYGRPNANPF